MTKIKVKKNINVLLPIQKNKNMKETMYCYRYEEKKKEHQRIAIVFKGKCCYIGFLLVLDSEVSMRKINGSFQNSFPSLYRSNLVCCL